MTEPSVQVDQPETGDAVTRLWRQLPRLRRMTFTARPGAGSSAAWRGRGHADIKVVPAGDDWLLLEQGHFVPTGARQGLVFSNTYRWQWVGDRLRLQHERFGPDQTVFLFDIVAVDENKLVCACPHLCADDSYHGAIAMRPQGFQFSWRITGPRKDEHLLYRYQTR